ncbi:flagellar hook-length control protein FliK [Catenovulum maritimum]|uniref:Flagellar hook-length control protein-like C-terminal domain-containing protein n=1 Tax=Catenovulum maritimum TaxID=1513271 RepID=A0A0J8GUB6_9ALTE|nr:flagellar hook-length control protein FliK [Catenovulum maritimum]KMT64904.1 hypothetical protein XM47_11890 [Catenovulum maritimum]
MQYIANTQPNIAALTVAKTNKPAEVVSDSKEFDNLINQEQLKHQAYQDKPSPRSANRPIENSVPKQEAASTSKNPQSHTENATDTNAKNTQGENKQIQSEADSNKATENKSAEGKTSDSTKPNPALVSENKEKTSKNEAESKADFKDNNLDNTNLESSDEASTEFDLLSFLNNSQQVKTDTKFSAESKATKNADVSVISKAILVEKEAGKAEATGELTKKAGLDGLFETANKAKSVFNASTNEFAKHLPKQSEKPASSDAVDLLTASKGKQSEEKPVETKSVMIDNLGLKNQDSLKETDSGKSHAAKTDIKEAIKSEAKPESKLETKTEAKTEAKTDQDKAEVEKLDTKLAAKGTDSTETNLKGDEQVKDSQEAKLAKAKDSELSQLDKVNEKLNDKKNSEDEKQAAQVKVDNQAKPDAQTVVMVDKKANQTEENLKDGKTQLSQEELNQVKLKPAQDGTEGESKPVKSEAENKPAEANKGQLTKTEIDKLNQDAVKDKLNNEKFAAESRLAENQVANSQEGEVKNQDVIQAKDTKSNLSSKNQNQQGQADAKLTKQENLEKQSTKPDQVAEQRSNQAEIEQIQMSQFANQSAQVEQRSQQLNTLAATATTQVTQTEQQIKQAEKVLEKQTYSLKEQIQLSKPEAASQLNDSVKFMMNSSSQMAELRLDPPELGKMQIKISMNGDVASVSMVVQNQQAKEMLDQAVPKLKELLEEQGIQLGESHVSQQQQESGGKSATGRNGQGANPDNTTGIDGGEIISEQKIVNGHLGEVDYYA